MGWLFKKHSVWLWCALLIASLSFLIYKDRQDAKPAASPTKAEIARNQCAETAYKSYLNEKIALGQIQMELVRKLQSTMELAIRKRRLQETFCQQYTDCLRPDQPQKFAAILRNGQFERCLLAEAAQEVDLYRAGEAPTLDPPDDPRR